MTKLNQMYQLLEEMVKNAEEGNTEKVRELNNLYESLVPQIYHDPPTGLELKYDRCRQSCVMSLTMFKHNYRAVVLDARKTFSKIPKPQK